jgi:hypothetical protein
MYAQRRRTPAGSGKHGKINALRPAGKNYLAKGLYARFKRHYISYSQGSKRKNPGIFFQYGLPGRVEFDLFC